MSKKRRKDESARITEEERTAGRGGLGALQWVGVNTLSSYLVDTSLLQSELSKGSIGTLIKINKAIKRAKEDTHTQLIFRGFGGEELS